MIIGYKGFDKDLTCKTEKFSVGETYSKGIPINGLKMCSSDGWHYCTSIEKVFKWYPREKGNRYCVIEVLGDFKNDHDKSITNSFRIVKEIDMPEVDEKLISSNLNLELVRDIQDKYSMFHVGGSVGLFLHGVRLDRWKNPGRISDIDMVSPYFILPSKTLIGIDGDEYEVVYIDGKASANDFDVTFLVDGTKVDYRIDPKQRYEIINYDGYDYKVSPLFTILEAKMRYALTPFGGKHKKDIIEMVTSKKIATNINDKPFEFPY